MGWLFFIFSYKYFAIFILMTLESTFFPFPSEIVLIPSGFFIYKGYMNFYFVLLASILGSIFGALINYVLALKLGRPLVYKLTNYFLFSKKQLVVSEKFFLKYAKEATFFGRLLPGIRQYISFPAGFVKMNIIDFITYTFLGSFIWSVFLIILGYALGQNEALIEHYIKIFVVVVILIIIIFILAYRYFISLMSKDPSKS